MPPQTQALIDTHRIRLAARALGIAKLDAGPNAIQLQFIPNPPIDPARIIALIQSDRTVKLAGQDKLVWQKATSTLKERTTFVQVLFGRLTR
jgi:transcription-repair coupling factor (superfamily II helicase)